MSVIRNSGVSAVEGGLNVSKSMGIQSGHSELSIISQVSTVEGCPLSRVPLYYANDYFMQYFAVILYSVVLRRTKK